jgi:hypothetical protein
MGFRWVGGSEPGALSPLRRGDIGQARCRRAFTARANIGIHNDDGSTGFNLGVGATAVGFEGTVGGTSALTYGVAASVGAAVSVGVRDIDRDGSGELCARVSIGPVTVGACLENPL